MKLKDVLPAEAERPKKNHSIGEAEGESPKNRKRDIK